MAKKQAKLDPNFLHFLCARCRAPIQAPLALAGRFMDCPKCKNKTAIPENQKEADEDKVDLGVQRMSYNVVDGKCFKCAKKMPSKDAVICIKCGFNHRDGKQLQTNDVTVKDDEPRRGGPAFGNMVACGLIGVVLLGVMIWRLLDGSPRIWWEQSLYLAFSLFLLALVPPLFLQWHNYKTLPIRDHAGVKEENRAEREEAMSPYDNYTAGVFILCMLIGFAIMTFAFSRNIDTGQFEWPWEATNVPG